MILIRKIKIGNRYPLAFTHLGNHVAPRVDNDRLAVRLPTKRVLAVLRGSENVNLRNQLPPQAPLCKRCWSSRANTTCIS